MKMNIEVVDDEWDPKFQEIWCQGVFWKKIYKAFFKKVKLRSLKSKAELAHIVHEVEEREVKKLLLKSLAQKRCFSHELREKLLKYALPKKIIETEIRVLQRQGYINDKEYLNDAIRARIQKGEGPYVIAWKLANKSGLSLERLLAILDKKYPKKEQFLQMKRYAKGQTTFQKLQRKGFSLDIIQEFLR